MIKEHSDIGRISRDLAIIQTNIELPFDIKDLVYEGYDFQTINEFCQKYGLKQFINKVQPKWKKKSLSEITIDVKTVNSLKGYEVGNDLGIAIDYENDNYTIGSIYGVAFSFNNEHLYISLEDLKKDECALKILKDKNIKKYCYDYKAIKVALKKNNIDIEGVYFDLLIASYLVDSSLKNNPEVVMNIYGIDLTMDEEEMSLF